VLLREKRKSNLSAIHGWRQLETGFLLVFLGTVIDITDNFPELDFLVVIGDTPAQAILEKVFGYLLGFVFLALGILRWLPQVVERHEMIRRDLKAVRQEVKVLRGFLPICAACKKIRDDAGYWTQIESYIRKHSEAEFSHGICPDCARELYPDLVKGRLSGDEEKEP
jgi:hypothetical protein